MRELGDSISGFRRFHHQLPRYSPTASMQRQGLFGRQTPLRSETLSEIDRAKLPVRCVLGRALTGCIIRTARYEPALQNRVQKSMSDETLSQVEEFEFKPR